MRAGSVLAWLAFALIVPPAIAQDQAPPSAGHTLFIITGASADPAQCNTAVATPVAFADVLKHSERFIGQCISTVGYFDHWTVKPKRHGAFMAMNTPDDRVRQVGFYASDDVYRRISTSDTTRARFVGLLHDCESLYDTGAIMVSGYCHYTLGPYLAVASFHPIR